MCIPRATVSAVFCLVVPAFICIDLLISRVLKINDDDDHEGKPRGEKLNQNKGIRLSEEECGNSVIVTPWSGRTG